MDISQPPPNQPDASTQRASFVRKPKVAIFVATLVLICLLAAVFFFWPTRLANAQQHPIFNTPVSSMQATRPAIQVDVIDDSEVVGTAELYLTVQSSRSDADTRIIFPINVRDFQGCTSRFIQLPFEVETGDSLAIVCYLIRWTMTISLMAKKNCWCTPVNLLAMVFSLLAVFIGLI